MSTSISSKIVQGPIKIAFHLIMIALLATYGCSSEKDNKTEDAKDETMTTENTDTMQKPAFYPALTAYVNDRLEDMDTISEERKADLKRIAQYIMDQTAKGDTARLTFICTHNSRRSHLSQIWAQVAASHYGIAHVESFSGGTEATAFNPRAVAAIERAGFIVKSMGGENPNYMVSFANDESIMRCFSKKFDDAFNPDTSFAAIMTCSQADEACPFVPGANARIAIPYEDPKVADGTDHEAAKYDDRCAQIAAEMLFVMSQVTSGA